jgi:hypothetical protein
MSSIPNYVGTPAQVNVTHDPEYLGQAVPQNVKPVHHTMQHPSQHTQPFFQTAPRTRSELFGSVQAHRVRQDQAYRNQLELRQDFAPTFAPGYFDRPIDETTHSYEPLTQYARDVLQHTPSYTMKIMRGPT